MSKTEPEITVIFAGSGESTEANTKELLDTWLPEDVGGVVIQTEVSRENKGLRTVETFLENEFGEDAITRVEDALSYIKGLDLFDEQYYLVLLWNDDDESRELLEAADGQGIVVK